MIEKEDLRMVSDQEIRDLLIKIRDNRSSPQALISVFNDYSTEIYHCLDELMIHRAESTCEHCGTSNNVKKWRSATAYHWNGEGEDPNRSLYLCLDCALQYYQYWEEMWREANQY